VPFISVNVTAIDLARDDFIATLRRMLHASGLPARSLKIEVTESVLMQDPAGVARTLQACRALGTGIAVDDFGTGYSSLSSLSLLPISTLKVDRSFVRSMLSEPASRKIVQTILRLAEELGLPVIAEGIEEEAQARALAAMGCAFGQGYLFGRPAPLAATLELLRAWRPRSAERAPARRMPATVGTTEP
jgi:EAL domain-containing protein (putative c-di-GMP-specific phosphodiesterase class I)